MINAKEENNIVKFDMSRDRLVDFALEKIENKEYTDALSLLNKCVDFYGPDEEIFEAYADIFETLELYPKALDVWFSYLSMYGGESADVDEEIYEGLSVDFMNLGLEMEALVYYKKMLDAASSNPFRDDSERVADFEISGVIENRRPQFRLVTDEENDKTGDAISEGLHSLKMNDPEGAIRALSNAEKNSPLYLHAANLTCLSYVLGGDLDKGEKECEKILKEYPDDIQILSTLAAIYTEKGETEKSKEIALRLCEREDCSPDALYKIATVACENGLDEQAKEKFLLLEEKMPYDKTLLYFLAVSEFRTGDIEGAKAHLRRLLAFYPDSCVAKEQLRKIILYEDEAKKDSKLTPPFIPYIYRLSDEERRERTTYLKGLKPSDIENPESGQIEKIEEYFNWCFDEYDGQDVELQHFAVYYAVKRGCDEIIAKILIKREVSYLIKVFAFYRLILRNRSFEFDYLLGDMFMTLNFNKIKLGRTQRNNFLESAAHLISEKSLFDTELIEKISRATEDIYDYAVNNNGYENIPQEDLMCAILYRAREDGEDKGFLALLREFNADMDGVLRLLPPVSGDGRESDSDAIISELMNELMKSATEEDAQK